MNLTIDIGNTLHKIAIFKQDEIFYCQSFPKITEDIIISIINHYKIINAIVSSVAELDSKMIDCLQAHTNLIHYSHKTRLPLTILYKSVETLGLDRIACAVGASTLYPNQNVLSIQAGTCLVFDFVNKKREYLGGSIAPGLKMRFEALHEKTKKLPLLSAKDLPTEFIGNNTENSITCGIINGMCHEIDGFICDYQTYFKDVIVLFSGGDANFLHKFIKNTIFAAPNVVLSGLNEIIKYNV